MKKALIASLIFLSCNSQATPLVCSDIFISDRYVTQLSNEANELMVVVYDSGLAFIFDRSEKISWHAFESMNKVTDSIEKYAAFLNKMTPQERRTELQQLLRSLEHFEKENPSLAAFFSGDFSKISEGTYKPAEYKLRRELQSKLTAALQKLPAEFRPRISKLTYDKSAKAVNDAAVKLMDEQVISFDRLFKQFSGTDYATFEKNLRSSEDPAVKKAISIIDHEQIEVVMRRPESGRFWIPRTGFQNQYVTGSSKGWQSELRKDAESLMTDKTRKEYWALNEDVMPKYGTLKAAKESGLINNLESSAQYGEDLYTFKKSALEGRLSFFPGDSLNHLAGSWFLAPGAKIDPTSWDKVFVPWNRRLLMVPFMVTEIRETNTFKSPRSSDLVPTGFSSGGHNYWESQIFGRATLDMVETFEFKKNPPDRELLAELKKHNIKIIDGRQQPAIEWKEQ